MSNCTGSTSAAASPNLTLVPPPIQPIIPGTEAVKANRPFVGALSESPDRQRGPEVDLPHAGHLLRHLHRCRVRPVLAWAAAGAAGGRGRPVVVLP